jgi:hypothetical protein
MKPRISCCPAIRNPSTIPVLPVKSIPGPEHRTPKGRPIAARGEDGTTNTRYSISLLYIIPSIVFFLYTRAEFC